MFKLAHNFGSELWRSKVVLYATVVLHQGSVESFCHWFLTGGGISY